MYMICDGAYIQCLSLHKRYARINIKLVQVRPWRRGGWYAVCGNNATSTTQSSKYCQKRHTATSSGSSSSTVSTAAAAAHTAAATTTTRTALFYQMKIHCSCEMEYFVETHLCKLCVILQSRVLRVVCPHYSQGIGRRLPLQLQCSYQGQRGDVMQSVRGTIKP